MKKKRMIERIEVGTKNEEALLAILVAKVNNVIDIINQATEKKKEGGRGE